MFEGIELNEVAILVAAASNMVIGSVWYASFAKPWAKLIGKTEKQLRDDGMAGVGYLVAIVTALLSSSVVAIVSYWAGVVDGIEGLVVGGVLWALVSSMLAVNYAFSQRPLKLFLLDAGNLLLTLLAAGAIIGAWQ